MRLTIRICIAVLCIAAVSCKRSALQSVSPNIYAVDAHPSASGTNVDATRAATAPVVQAVMYWMNGCPGCLHTLENVLPPIQSRFGDQFEMQLIELVGTDEYLNLVQMAEALGVPKEKVFVPFMILGEHALVGPDQIQAELPSLIEKYLALGGIGWTAGLELSDQKTSPADSYQNPDASRKSVHFIVFTTLDCHSCRDELAEALRPVLEMHSDQVEYQTIDVRTSEDLEYLYGVASNFGFERELVDLPMVIIGKHMLMGEGMAAQLPYLVEGFLFSGGIDYPSIPAPPGQATSIAMTTVTPIPGTPPSTPVSVPAPTEKDGVDGFGLAITVLAFIAFSLVYAIARLALAVNKGAGQSKIPSWHTWAVPLLSIFGVLLAGYLAYIETRLVHAFCGPVGECNTVQASTYAHLFGFIPLGLLGTAGYFAILAVWIWGQPIQGRIAGYSKLAVTGMALFGSVFSLYLTYLELFVIQAICLWCTSSAVIMTLLLLASLNPAAEALGRQFRGHPESHR